MFDDNLMFSEAQALNADAYSESVVNIKKTPASGVWVEAAATAMATTATIDVLVLEKDTDADWDYTSDLQRVGTFRLSGSGSRNGRLIQSNKAYLKLYYNGDAWGTATVTAGISSGPERDFTA